eukprot:818149-Alexandrium_andersonii.AAC.1
MLVCASEAPAMLGTAFPSSWRLSERRAVMLQTVYGLLLVAGAPIGVTTAFCQYMEQVQVFGSYGQGVGSLHRRVQSIPQGCPMSMMVLTLTTAAWINSLSAGQGEDATHIMRVLADDILVGSTCSDESEVE